MNIEQLHDKLIFFISYSLGAFMRDRITHSNKEGDRDMIVQGEKLLPHVKALLILAGEHSQEFEEIKTKLIPEFDNIQDAAKVCAQYGVRISIQAIGSVPRSHEEQRLRDAIELLEKQGWRVNHMKIPYEPL